MNKRESMESEAESIIKNLSDESLHMLIQFAKGLIIGQNKSNAQATKRLKPL